MRVQIRSPWTIWYFTAPTSVLECGTARSMTLIGILVTPIKSIASVQPALRPAFPNNQPYLLG